MSCVVNGNEQPLIKWSQWRRIFVFKMPLWWNFASSCGNLPSVSFNSLFTNQVIILCDGSCHSCSWPLLGKLISKLEDPWILLEHLGNFHLYSCSQLLSLMAGVDTYSGRPRRKRKQLLVWKRCMAICWTKGKSHIERDKVTWDISLIQSFEICSLSRSQVQ